MIPNQAHQGGGPFALLFYAFAAVVLVMAYYCIAMIFAEIRDWIKRILRKRR